MAGMSQRAIVVLGHASTPFGLSSRQKKRLDKALELMQRGDADLIITTGGIGLFNPSSPPLAHRMKDYLAKGGIAERQILIEDLSKNTRENALYILPFLAANHIGSLTVMTSADHMGRARYIFQQTVPPDIQLNFVISDYFSGLWTVWDALWHTAGWVKLAFRDRLGPH